MERLDMTKTIRAVLFDADGVIVTPPFLFVAYLKRELGLTMDHTRAFFEGPFLDCLVGRADLKQAIAPFLPGWGWATPVEDFLQRWFEEEHVINAPMVPLIKALQDQGIICGLATNQERYRLAYMRREMGFSTLFDAVFGSAELGAAKPDRTFYRRVTDALKVAPDEILFWDDSGRNVDAARAYGWQAEPFETYQAFQSVMVDRFPFLLGVE
jgi:putative hydrolase of the HAD superfamily